MATVKQAFGYSYISAYNGNSDHGFQIIYNPNGNNGEGQFMLQGEGKGVYTINTTPR